MSDGETIVFFIVTIPPTIFALWMLWEVLKAMNDDYGD